VCDIKATKGHLKKSQMALYFNPGVSVVSDLLGFFGLETMWGKKQDGFTQSQLTKFESPKLIKSESYRQPTTL